MRGRHEVSSEKEPHRVEMTIRPFLTSPVAIAEEDQEYLRKLIQARVDELVRQLDEAAKIEEKFAREFARVITDPNLK